MFVITYFDWFGEPEELKELKEAWKKICEETDGVKYKGLWTSHQARYHYAWFTKADSYGKLMEANNKMPPRDRKKLTHAVTEIFNEM